jgi:hypothetical protein
MGILSSLGNARSLGTQSRTGAAILTSSRANRASIGRIYNQIPVSKRGQFIRSMAIFLYGPNGSVYQRGV